MDHDRHRGSRQTLALPGRRPGPAFPLPQGPPLPGARYDLELAPGWNLVSYEPEDPGIHRAWVYGREEAYWKVWAR
jgi:hypothetical protein